MSDPTAEEMEKARQCVLESGGTENLTSQEYSDLEQRIGGLIHSHAEEAVKARDREWVEAIAPGNSDTDYGRFMADPKRAALLLKEKDDLAREEQEAAVKARDEEWAKTLGVEFLDDNRPLAEVKDLLKMEKAEAVKAATKELRAQLQAHEEADRIWAEGFDQSDNPDDGVAALKRGFVQERQARREGAEEMRERAARRMAVGDFCRAFEHAQDLCECEEREGAIRALPIDPPKGDQYAERAAAISAEAMSGLPADKRERRVSEFEARLGPMTRCAVKVPLGLSGHVAMSGPCDRPMPCPTHYPDPPSCGLYCGCRDCNHAAAEKRRRTE